MTRSSDHTLKLRDTPQSEDHSFELIKLSEIKTSTNLREPWSILRIVTNKNKIHYNLIQVATNQTLNFRNYE